MRIYQNFLEAVNEVSRDLWEMGIRVHPQTYQDKDIASNPDFDTLEVRGYSFKVCDAIWSQETETRVLAYVFQDEDVIEPALKYVQAEFEDRVSGWPLNPGNSYQHRLDVWNEFLHDGLFSYTYSERLAPQFNRIVGELRQRPDTRQAILTIHSNINAENYVITNPDGSTRHDVIQSADLENTGGKARIPCSMYYQLMIREGKLDLIYTMRSCDFLTHFPVDIMIANRIQNQIAKMIVKPPGMFTYFTGSLHAYQKDLAKRGIF